MPFTISGVVSVVLTSWLVAPKLSNFQVQATARFFTVSLSS
jgi:hypothetical protein